MRFHCRKARVCFVGRKLVEPGRLSQCVTTLNMRLLEWFDPLGRGHQVLLSLWHLSGQAEYYIENWGKKWTVKLWRNIYFRKILLNGCETWCWFFYSALFAWNCFHIYCFKLSLMFFFQVTRWRFCLRHSGMNFHLALVELSDCQLVSKQ